MLYMRGKLKVNIIDSERKTNCVELSLWSDLTDKKNKWKLIFFDIDIVIKTGSFCNLLRWVEESNKGTYER